MIRNALVSVVLLFAFAAGAVDMPPYEVYPYMGDDTDSPKINYMKVCEPGCTGEVAASYVVLGISYPQTVLAIDVDFDGDLSIPAYVDGLPVRKVNEAAFIECGGLRSVRIPSTVREIGDRAFADCYLLTNVVFGSGVSRIGNAAFSNCVSLSEIRMPKTLSRLGSGCFQGCVSLTDVYFDGNAPRIDLSAGSDKSPLGEAIFRQTGYVRRFRVHVNLNAYGWISPYEKGVPEKWPVDCGFMQAHETVAEEASASAEEATGFVTVITEIRGGAVAIPEVWSRRYPSYAAKFGNDFVASLTKPTGKTDASGRAMQVRQDFVAGTDPTDPNDRFAATITMRDGRSIVGIRPELSVSEKARRKYTVWGKSRLADQAWQEVTFDDMSNYNFFKVTVEMRDAPLDP